MRATSPGGFAGLYVHVPFCARACPYCDFDFEVGALHKIPDYLRGIQAQVQAVDPSVWQPFDTIYLGGGTPSILSAAQLAELFDGLSPLAKAHDMREVTVEFNPEHADTSLMHALRDLGVNRVSLGVQSFAADALVTLGRAHRAHKAKAAIEAAMDAGLSVSCDLMVGWPGQGAAQLKGDLDALLELGVPHISVYALTIEPASSWPTLVQRGLREMPDEDLQAAQLAQVESVLVGAGYAHYEVASYAKPGAMARHNAKYWSAQNYLGLGPSAHSARYDAGGSVHRWGRVRGLDAWLAAPCAQAQEEQLSPEDSAREALWLGLRRLDGLDLGFYLQRFPQVDAAWVQARVQGLLDQGLLQRDGARLQVAPGRWLMHDAIAHELL